MAQDRLVVQDRLVAQDRVVAQDPGDAGEGAAALERARRASTWRTLVGCNIGVCLEGFDFIAFGFFAAIIGKTFFPASDELASQLLAFASFGFAYVARPLGGIFWGLYADRMGRRPALAFVSITMAVGVAMIAFTPSYAAIGIAAPILMMLARLIQGFSAGGEFASATSMLVEYAPTGRRGLYASTQMASQALTIAAASALVLILNRTLTQETLESYGWRAVFVFGILIGPIGFYMRARLAETPEFRSVVAARGMRGRERLGEVLGRHRYEALSIAGLTAVGSASFYLIMIYLPVRLAPSLGVPMNDAQIATIINSLVQIIVCLLGGWLSDLYGRRAILLPATLAYALICYPLFAYLIGNPSFASLLLVQGAIGLLLGFISGPFPAAISELLPTEIRSSGLGIIYNIIGAIFGGLGPFLITSLIALTGDKASPAYWALFTGVIGAGAALCLRKVAGRAGEARPSSPKEKVAIG